jgi:hypothetical protein
MKTLLLALAVLTAGPSISYKLPAAGYVSLAVYDSSGTMVRPLLYGVQQPVGAHIQQWDGLDRYGQPVPPGQYQWRLLQTPGFSREFLVDVGASHLWSVLDGWPGNHTGPTLVYVGPDDSLYIAAQISEGPPHIVKLTPDGRKKHWADSCNSMGGFDSQLTAMVVNGGVLYCKDLTGKVYPFDAHTLAPLNAPTPAKLAFPDPAQATDIKNNQTLKIVGNTVQRLNANGTPAATYGASRVYGKFDPLQFDTLLAIACDSQGNFYTIEQYPRRVAKFTSDFKLVDQWFGGQHWGTKVSVDPADPTVFCAYLDDSHLSRGKIDHANRDWTVTDVFPIPPNSTWVEGCAAPNRAVWHVDILPGTYRYYWEVRHVGTDTYLLCRSGLVDGSGVTVLKVDEVNKKLVPVATLGAIKYSAPSPPDWWLQKFNLAAGMTIAQAMQAAGPGQKRFSYTWSDANGNGAVDQEEILVASVGNQLSHQRYAVDSNWNITMVGQVNNRPVLATIINEGTSAAPAWNFDHWKTVSLQLPAAEATAIGFSSNPTAAVEVGADGSVYVAMNAVPPKTPTSDPYPANQTTHCTFLKFDAAGKLLFSVGQHGTDKSGSHGPAPGGSFTLLRSILGTVNDNVVLVDACAPACVFTSDGLYAGCFRDDAGYNPAWLGADATWQQLAYGQQQITNTAGNSRKFSPVIGDDVHTGELIVTPKGEVIWGQQGVNSMLFYRIKGFDRWQRQSGMIEVKSKE